MRALWIGLIGLAALEVSDAAAQLTLQRTGTMTEEQIATIRESAEARHWFERALRLDADGTVTARRGWSIYKDERTGHSILLEGEEEEKVFGYESIPDPGRPDAAWAQVSCGCRQSGERGEDGDNCRFGREGGAINIGQCEGGIDSCECDLRFLAIGSNGSWIGRRGSAGPQRQCQ